MLNIVLSHSVLCEMQPALDDAANGSDDLAEVVEAIRTGEKVLYGVAVSLSSRAAIEALRTEVEFRQERCIGGGHGCFDSEAPRIARALGHIQRRCVEALSA
jgi:hypothetical protein